MYYKAIKLYKLKVKYKKYSKINLDRRRESRITGIELPRVRKIVKEINMKRKKGACCICCKKKKGMIAEEFDAQEYYKNKIV